MADYNKQTVAQLRQVLKDRGIPSTGLTRKAQIVEKLEEADNEGGEAPAAEAAEPAQANEDDAPSDPVAQVEDEDAPKALAKEEEVPGPALSETGGMLRMNMKGAHKADKGTEPAAQPDQGDPPPVPTATLDGNRETISHIDSDVPPPDQIKAIEHSAEDTTNDQEPGSIQPAGVFNAAPADPEDVVGPHITEPTDAEVEGEKEEDLARDELPDAPGPAAEALRLKRQDQETVMEDATPTGTEEPSVEKAELLPIPERSTAETSRLPTEELEADTKKRKRRSGSPDLPLQDIKAKKPRSSHEPAPEVHLKEDDDVVMEQRPASDDTKPSHSESTDVDNRTLKKERTDRYQNLVKPSNNNDTPDALQDDTRPIAPALHPATPALPTPQSYHHFSSTP
jgi:hypothetical protein